jgi:glycosyl-4,4'-diaponeurosporenoate acyltransferase
MLFHLPTLPTILIDIAAWFVIHMSVSYFMTHIPLSSFGTDFWLYKSRKWENNGKIYQRIFVIKSWKKKLPDGAAIFKEGFQKKTLMGLDNIYLDNFIRETCRAELTHWIVFLFGPVFLLWNLWWVGILRIIYALCVNLPCILTQRYNRIRLKRVLFKLRNLSLGSAL